MKKAGASEGTDGALGPALARLGDADLRLLTTPAARSRLPVRMQGQFDSVFDAAFDEVFRRREARIQAALAV